MFIIQVTTVKNIDIINVTVEMTLEEAIIFSNQQAQRALGLVCSRTLKFIEEVNVYITSTQIGGFVATFIDGEWEVE